MVPQPDTEGFGGFLLSFDVEDWHQLVHRRLGRPDWDLPGPAFERQVVAMLELLDELGVRATLFLLGMTAERYPDLMGELGRSRHEIACHGFAHTRVYEQSREEFRADLLRALEAIERTTGRRPSTYRAPAFSINRRTSWAYEVLAELGFRWDSSQYDSPRIPDRISPVPAVPYRLALDGGSEIWELPVPTWRRIPIGGGAYWRVLPAPLLRRGLREVSRQNAFPVLYFHPYELDPEPLRAALPAPSGRQRLVAASRSVWRNTRRTVVADRLRRLAADYRLLSYNEAYDDIAGHYGTRTRSLSQEGVLV